MDTADHRGQDSSLEPQWFLVQPPVKAAPIPVLRDPIDATSIIARIKGNTVVTSSSRSAMWRHIELPNGQSGYIQVAYTRPLTADEQVAVEQSRSPQGAKNGTPLRTTSEGLIGVKTGGRRLSRSLAGVFAALSLASCVLGGFLDQIEEQQCATYGFGGTSCQTIAHPYASIGGIFALLAFGLLIAAVIAGIAWFSKNARSR